MDQQAKILDMRKHLQLSVATIARRLNLSQSVVRDVIDRSRRFLHCHRCSHNWENRRPQRVPEACPKCNSRHWSKKVRPKLLNRPQPDPTPEEIESATARIRATWHREEERKRGGAAGYVPAGIPVVETGQVVSQE